jgi:hypothetical protein
MTGKPKEPLLKKNSPSGEISPMQKGLVTGNLGKGYGGFFGGHFSLEFRSQSFLTTEEMRKTRPPPPNK